MKSNIAPREGADRSEAEVADFLRATPDFFDRYPDVLMMMKLRHGVPGATSLIEYQLRLLRERNSQLERKLMSLVETARDNEALSLRVHRLSLALIDTDTVEEVISTSVDQLRNEFKTERVNVALFDDPASAAAGATLEAVDKAFPNLFGGRRPFSGILGKQQARLLFGDDGGGERIASAAVAPLFDTRPQGFLALGSTDDKRFQPGMGVLFLRYLGDLVSAAITHHRRLERG